MNSKELNQGSYTADKPLQALATVAGRGLATPARAMAALSQKPTYLSITSLVCSEITGVTTQLRADARASVSSYMGASATIPRLQRSFKKARDVALHYGPDHDCMEYLEPFLETIRCEETTGVVTQRALSAVHCFLRAELLSLNPSSAPAAMVAVVKAATYCRFEVTDPAADEVRSPPPRPRGGWPPASATAAEVVWQLPRHGRRFRPARRGR